jgi:hypothetical protein
MRSSGDASGSAARSLDLKRVRLVRTLDDGRKEAVAIAFNLILKSLAPFVALKDRDTFLGLDEQSETGDDTSYQRHGQPRGPL